ncbi:hypothetical protein J2747_001357 [Thermococcus stetteri]|nr:hypothetical protein [Thermococcus stetteri]
MSSRFGRKTPAGVPEGLPVWAVKNWSSVSK